jgi:hypothetical protein
VAGGDDAFPSLAEIDDEWERVDLRPLDIPRPKDSGIRARAVPPPLPGAVPTDLATDEEYEEVDAFEEVFEEVYACPFSWPMPAAIEGDAPLAPTSTSPPFWTLARTVWFFGGRVAWGAWFGLSASVRRAGSYLTGEWAAAAARARP